MTAFISTTILFLRSNPDLFTPRSPLGTRRCWEGESTSMTLIQCRNNPCDQWVMISNMICYCPRYHVHPGLAQGWVSVADGMPTSNRHWANGSWCPYHIPINRMHWTNVGSMLVQQHWPDIGWRFVIAWCALLSVKLNDHDHANTMKYGGGLLYNLVFTEWRYCVSQNEV